MLRRVFKAAGWTLLGLAALCVVLYLIAVAINWRDQEPSATAVRLASLYRKRPVVADDDNAYVYLMGFGVSPDESPHDLGLKRIAWMQGSDEGGRLDLAGDPLGERPDYRSERPPAISSYLEACGTGDSGCAAAFDAATDRFEQWVATENWLPERYLALIDHTGWREEVPLSLVSPIPSYGLVMEGQKLLLLDAKVLARKGDHAGVRDLLARDLLFWRRVFESSDRLLTKMIAKAAPTNPLRNPYTGRPFEWDGEAVVFRGLEPGTRGEHRHYY